MDSDEADAAAAVPATSGNAWRAALGAAASGEGQRAHGSWRVLRGSAWTTLGFASTQGFRLVSTLVLARLLLGPEAFGLVALVQTLLLGLEMFSDLGIATNVIRHPRGGEPRFLSTAFWLQAGRGLVLWAIAALLAVPFARFYDSAELVPLTLLAGAGLALRSAASPVLWELTRRVELRFATLVLVASEAIGFAVSLAWAWQSPSAMALVAGSLASAAAFCAGSYLDRSARPRLEWDSAAARDTLSFGAWLFVSTATYFLAGQGERLWLGGLVSAVELGCFSVALMLASAPARALAQIATQVFLPLLARELQRGDDAAALAYRRARLAFLAAAVAVGALFVAFGPWFVRLALPPEFAMAGWMLQLLGARAGFDVFIAPATNLLLASGRAGYAAAANALRLVILAAGLALVFGAELGGIEHAVWVLLAAAVLAYGVFLPGIARQLPGVIAREVAEAGAYLAVLAAVASVPWPWNG